MRFESNFYICEQQKLANVLLGSKYPTFASFQSNRSGRKYLLAREVRWSNHAFASFSLLANVFDTSQICPQQRSIAAPSTANTGPKAPIWPELSSGDQNGQDLVGAEEM